MDGDLKTPGKNIEAPSFMVSALSDPKKCVFRSGANY